MKVLIVDDNKEVLSTTELMLKALGHKTITAENAEQALETLGDRKDIEIIFTDLGLPKIDGWEFIRMIRANGLKMPIVAVTGIARMIANGVQEELNVHRVIEKPYKLHELQSILNELEDTIDDS
ncbi:MAG: response regulator [candidate division Zixibacteria bacterium]|nr:response regulator [candidate division Zixibacteria bacterium]